MSVNATLRVSTLAICLAAALAGCDDNPTAPTDDAVFRVQACGNQGFNVRMADPDVIEQAQQLVGDAEQPILLGKLLRGSGGFNNPYPWHLDPATIEFADLAIEVCDGCPADIDDDLDYWVDTVGQFCPWTSRVLFRVR